MKNFLSIDRTPSFARKSISAASKLKSELPTDLEMESIPPMELLSLVEDIYVKTQKASVLTLTCKNSLGLIKPYKACSLNS